MDDQSFGNPFDDINIDKLEGLYKIIEEHVNSDGGSFGEKALGIINGRLFEFVDVEVGYEILKIVKLYNLSIRSVMYDIKAVIQGNNKTQKRDFIHDFTSNFLSKSLSADTKYNDSHSENIVKGGDIFKEALTTLDKGQLFFSLTGIYGGKKVIKDYALNIKSKEHWNNQIFSLLSQYQKITLDGYVNYQRIISEGNIKESKNLSNIEIEVYSGFESLEEVLNFIQSDDYKKEYLELTFSGYDRSEPLGEDYSRSEETIQLDQINETHLFNQLATELWSVDLSVLKALSIKDALIHEVFINRDITVIIQKLIQNDVTLEVIKKNIDRHLMIREKVSNPQQEANFFGTRYEYFKNQLEISNQISFHTNIAFRGTYFGKKILENYTIGSSNGNSDSILTEIEALLSKMEGKYPLITSGMYSLYNETLLHNYDINDRFSQREIEIMSAYLDKNDFIDKGILHDNGISVNFTIIPDGVNQQHLRSQ